MLADVGMCPATLITDLAGATGDDVRRALAAAQEAGVQAVSLWTPHLDLLGGAASAAKWLSNTGLRVGAVEAATVWASGSADGARREAEWLAEVVATVGAPKLMAVTMNEVVGDPAAAQANLAALTEAVGGAQVCVEFLPWSGIPSLAAAWELVEPIGPGAGILVDSWHWQRQPGGPNPELLGQIPGERIGYVQVCDAAPGDGRDLVEAMSARLLPGDGVVDFTTLFRTLDAIGAQPFVATEIFNPVLVNDMGAEAFAHASIATARRALASSE